MKTIKPFAIFAIFILLIVGACTYEGNELVMEDGKILIKEKIAVAEKEDGSIAYIEEDTLLARPGKGRKPRVLQLGLPLESLITTQDVTNVMLDPVEYTGVLPTDNNGGLVDWDGDGLEDDLIEYHTRCYFPRSFASVTVSIDGENPRVINNSIAFGATLLGFVDADNDGDMDIIWEGGNHYRYNSETFGTADETYSQYNVGYNTFAEEPTPLADLVASLVVEQSVNNPNFVRWDLGPQYDAYIFHVKWHEIDTVGNVISPYYQTHTYGEWGIEASYFGPGQTWVITFSNVAEPCDDVSIIVNF